MNPYQWTINDFPEDLRHICYSAFWEAACELHDMIPDSEMGEEFEQMLHQWIAEKYLGWSELTEPGFVMRPVRA